MISDNDHLRIVTRYTVMGEEASNVFDYRIEVVTGPVTYEEVVTNFNELVQGQMAISSVGVEFLGFDIYNMTNELDLHQHVYVTPPTGDRVGQGMPSFVAYGFKMVRETRATAHGAKRFGGVSETDVEGQYPVAAMYPVLADFAEQLGSPQVFDPATPSGDHILHPVIYGEALPARLNKAGETLPARPAVLNPVISAVFSALTTQKSRQLGR